MSEDLTRRQGAEGSVGHSALYQFGRQHPLSPAKRADRTGYGSDRPSSRADSSRKSEPPVRAHHRHCPAACDSRPRSGPRACSDPNPGGPTVTESAGPTRRRHPVPLAGSAPFHPPPRGSAISAARSCRPDPAFRRRRTNSLPARRLRAQSSCAASTAGTVWCRMGSRDGSPPGCPTR